MQSREVAELEQIGGILKVLIICLVMSFRRPGLLFINHDSIHLLNDDDDIDSIAIPIIFIYPKQEHKIKPQTRSIIIKKY